MSIFFGQQRHGAQVGLKGYIRWKRLCSLVEEILKSVFRPQDQDPTVAELTADSVVAAATKAVQSLESKDTTKSVRARIREEELRAAEEKARKAAEESKRAADEAAAAGLPIISILFIFLF